MSPDVSQELLKAVENAPLLSANASRLLEVTADPEHDLEDVIRIVTYDSAITARVLQVVNSAAFGLASRISSVDRAVSYLGTRMVVSIALSDSVGRFFEQPMDGYEGDTGDLWRHDLLTAFAARELARCSRTPFDRELAFTGGLLHDIGKAVGNDFLKGSAAGILHRIEQGEVRHYLEGEREQLGWDHTQIGEALSRHWNLPIPLQQVIRHHHRPSEAAPEWRPLVYAVHLGDLLSMMQGCATGSDSLQYRLEEGYIDYFSLDSNDLAAVLLEAQEGFRRAEASLACREENP